MKFLLLTLVTHTPDPLTGSQPSTHERLHQVVENAVLAEDLGFDGYAVGERHERPFISSAPPVILSHIAAKTSRLRLFTGVTTLSLLDPVRAYEDYATLDNLADGRLELIIGKGNGSAQRELFNITEEQQWHRNRESYEVFRRLWRNNRITWQGSIRPPLRDTEVWPLPLQRPLRVWHGSATSRESVDLAVEFGEPLFSANVTNPMQPYKELVDYYRRRWAESGHRPEDALVGAGTAGFLVRPNSQEAKDLFRPIFEMRNRHMSNAGLTPVWASYEDFLKRSSALVGSPQEVIEKVHHYHQALGHEVIHLHADGDGLTVTQHREVLELFQDEVAPELRRHIPSRPLGPQSGQESESVSPRGAGETGAPA